MTTGVRHATHGFTPSGFEIHYGHIPHKRTSLRFLLVICISLTLVLTGMLYKAYATSTFTVPTVTAPPSAPPHEAPAVTPVPTAPAATETPTISDKSDSLQQALDAWLAAHTDHQWSVSLKGLRGDPSKASHSATVNDDLASVYKLLMQYSLFKKVPRAQQDGKMLSVNGQSKSVTACIQAMILVSDNPCGEAVGYFVGWGNADRDLVPFGLHTKMGVNNTANTQDVALYLDLFDQGKLLNADDTAYIKSLLSQQRYRSGIPAGCSGCTVYNKVGDDGTQRNDAGIVEHDANHAYALVIFSNGASFGQIADLTRTLDAIMAP